MMHTHDQHLVSVYADALLLVIAHGIIERIL